MSRLTDQRGVTLIEVLVAASLMLLVTGATMAVLAAGSRQQRLVEQHNEAQQQVRTTLDRLARDLRNLASPAELSAGAVSSGAALQPASVERNLPYDLIFRVVGDVKPPSTANSANVRRVRYCLDATNPQRGVLWQQIQTWTTAAPPPMPSASSCPGSGWNSGADRIAAEGVVNLAGGLQRPLFRYAGDLGAISATDGASRAGITRVRADLHVDPDPTRSPRAAQLTTGVFLRNQNREPVATFTITGLNSTTRLIDLNGTASEDPEGQRLDYQFYVNPPSPLPPCSGPSTHASCILPSSARLQYVTPAPGTHTYVLRVSDSAGLTGISTQSFSYP